MEQRASGRSLEVVPQFIRSMKQRDVVGMLEIRLADDPRFTMRTAAIVHKRKLVQSKHALTAMSQLQAGCRPHSTNADNNRVEVRFASEGSRHRFAQLRKSIHDFVSDQIGIRFSTPDDGDLRAVNQHLGCPWSRIVIAAHRASIRAGTECGEQVAALHRR